MQKQSNNKQKNKNYIENDIPSIYEDDFVKITPYYILIDRYYFPLATSKTIFYSEIKTIELKSSKDVHTRWGISRSQLNHWFHLDSKRANKQYFLSIQLKDRKIKVGITPQKPLEAFYKIRELFSKNPQNQGDLQMYSNKSQLQKQENSHNDFMNKTESDQIYKRENKQVHVKSKFQIEQNVEQ